MRPRRTEQTAHERFTVWMSEEERHALRARADKDGSSENRVARLALREYLGVGAPAVKEVEVPV